MDFVYPQGPAQLGINFDEGKTLKNQYYELLNVLILSHMTSCVNRFLAFFGSKLDIKVLEGGFQGFLKIAIKRPPPFM